MALQAPKSTYQIMGAELMENVVGLQAALCHSARMDILPEY